MKTSVEGVKIAAYMYRVLFAHLRVKARQHHAGGLASSHDPQSDCDGDDPLAALCSKVVFPTELEGNRDALLAPPRQLHPVPFFRVEEETLEEDPASEDEVPTVIHSDFDYSTLKGSALMSDGSRQAGRAVKGKEGFVNIIFTDGVTLTTEMPNSSLNEGGTFKRPPVAPTAELLKKKPASATSKN